MGRDSQKCPPRPRICSPFLSFSFLSYDGFFCRLSPPPPRYVILRRKVATKQRGTRRRRGIKKKDRGGGGEKGAAAGGDCDKKTPAADAQRFPYFLPENYRREKIHGISKPPPPPLHTLFMQYMSHTQARTKPLSTEQQRGENRYRVREGGPLHFRHLVFPRISQKKVSRPRAWKIGADAIVGSVVIACAA